MKNLFVLFFLLVSLHAIGKKTFTNPILPGFHPDPSICRVGEDYYMVTSSFEWFPGLPIFHSKDLVHWEQIGHVLDRPSQLSMKEGLRASEGLWAPTIRYHEGTYYVICTATGCGGNFIVTAKDPQGPYSEPVFIEDAPGIDPSLYFEEDGTVWYAGSINGDDKIPPRKYPAEDRIYIQQIDVQTGKFLGERHIVTSGYAINSPYAEAPHIYKIKGSYYLIIAEGGTWEDHAVSVFKSDKITGPYVPFVTNPLLTHRHLGKGVDITTVGHADLVETQYGDWYAVMLGVRPLQGYTMLGRETFLTCVEFQDGCPIFNPGVGRVLAEDQFPRLPEYPVKLPEDRDDFTDSKLRYCWNFLRTPFEQWYTLKNGRLSLALKPQKLTEPVNPSLIARRIEQHHFAVTACLEFTPRKNNEEAGLVILQNDRYHYRLVLTKDEKEGKNLLRLIKVKAGEEILVSEREVKKEKVYLGILGKGLEYDFLYGASESDLYPLAPAQDATICSSNVAYGFIGPYVGMYASSNGQASKNKASFDWFEYKNLFPAAGKNGEKELSGRLQCGG